MIFEKHSVHLNRLESFYLMPFASYLPTQIISELKYYSYNTNISNDEQDFFSLAGIWENRNITTESIRQEAWRQGTK